MMLNALQRRIINRYQGGLPLLEFPYRAMADKLGCREADILDNLKQMLDQGLLSRFGPLYDAVQCGGGLTLAAMSVPEDRYEAVTAQVNSFAEVAHNYRREHELNMWFVLATDSPGQIDAVLQLISQTTGLEVYNFPKQQEFYIGLWLHLDEQGYVSTRPVPGNEHIHIAKHEIDRLDRAIIQQTQAGLELTSNPWQNIAAKVGSTSADVLLRIVRMKDCGIIRRIGVVPNHYRLGLVANGMTVWDVADSDSLRLGDLVGRLDFVSHCYLRPRHLPAWRYNLFAMVHGHNSDEVNEKVAQIAQLLGPACAAHDVLFSKGILKKTGMRLAA